MSKIAIVGSGIAGMMAAYLLAPKHEVHLFEATDQLGGHTHTAKVELDNKLYHIDMGFIVFNEKTYPNFCRFLEELKILKQPTVMSFSYRNDAVNLEYNGDNLKTLFAQKKNLLRPWYYQFLWSILAFNKAAKAFLAASTQTSGINLAQFIQQHNFPQNMLNYYLIPMLSAIWSTDFAKIFEYPLLPLLQFLDNHGLLSVNDKPQWYVLRGGSQSYVKALQSQSDINIHLGEPVKQVKRHGKGVSIVTSDSESDFDEVVMACHSDQALALLSDPSDHEQAVLGKIAYQDNDVVLHTDERLLPKHVAARASWNFIDMGQQRVSLTYYSNILQSIDSPHHFCVTVNQTAQIAPEKILKRVSFAHPLFDGPAIKAQSQFDLINGINHTYYCGAYWRHGFHEDGAWSAVRAVKSMGVNW